MSPISSVFSRRGWRSWQHFASVANDRHDRFAAARRTDRQPLLRQIGNETIDEFAV